jgi:hypothetical protein
MVVAIEEKGYLPVSRWMHRPGCGWVRDYIKIELARVSPVACGL